MESNTKENTIMPKSKLYYSCNARRSFIFYTRSNGVRKDSPCILQIRF